MSPIRGFGWLGGPLVATKGRQSARPTPTESSNEAKITPTMSPPSVSPLIRLLSPPPGYTELTAPPRMMSPKQHDFRASPYLHARSVQALMHSAMLTHSLQNECSMMTAGSELECGADGDVEKECVFRSSQGFLLWRKLRMGDCRAVTICFASIVCLSVVVGVLVFWKVFLPVMIEKSFSGGNLLSSQDPLMGITLFSISAFTSSGFNVSIALRKTGFTVPLNTPVTISAGSTCQFDAAWQDPTITSEPTWTPLLRVLPLVSEIRAANGVLSFNATRTDMEVLNGTAAGHLVSALAGTAGGKTARNESAGPWIRVTVAGDVTVGIFACPGMVLVNVVDLGSVMGDKVSGGNAGIVDVAGPEPLFANVTAEMARVGANSSVTSGVDIDLVFRNASGDNLGSPIAFPALLNVSFKAELGGVDTVASVTTSQLGLHLGDKVLHLPFEVKPAQDGSGVGGALTSLVEQVAAGKGGVVSAALQELLSSSTTALINNLVLDKFAVSGIEGEINVPSWMSQLFGSIRVAFINDSWIVGLVGSVLKSV